MTKKTCAACGRELVQVGDCMSCPVYTKDHDVVCEAADHTSIYVGKQ